MEWRHQKKVQDMTENLPNYASMEPPEEKPVEEYTTHERRIGEAKRQREATINQPTEAAVGGD